MAHASAAADQSVRGAARQVTDPGWVRWLQGGRLGWPCSRRSVASADLLAVVELGRKAEPRTEQPKHQRHLGARGAFCNASASATKPSTPWITATKHQRNRDRLTLEQCEIGDPQNSGSVQQRSTAAPRAQPAWATRLGMGCNNPADPAALFRLPRHLP
jgi:predicted component of type VI protein secretion system